LKEIGNEVFFSSGLKSIRIPNNVEKIGNGCFYSCESLSEIIFGSESKLKEIGRSAFYSSDLKLIRIPNNIEKLGNECFNYCKFLSEVIFESESKLKEIGKSAFYSCPLKCVRSEEGLNVKYNWPKDCRIEYIPRSNNEEREKKLNISDYVIELDKEYEFVEGIGEIELWRKIETGEEVAVKNYKLERCKGNNKDIQETFVREVEALFTLCFLKCNSLTEVIFESESKLKEMGKRAFSWSGLKSIRIPNNVEKLGDGCFCNCESLSEVIFESESKLKEIGGSAFSSSGLKSIRIPNNVEKLGDGCFSWCKSLSEVIFEDRP
jgi:hypothetical protein